MGRALAPLCTTILERLTSAAGEAVARQLRTVICVKPTNIVIAKHRDVGLSRCGKHVGSVALATDAKTLDRAYAGVRQLCSIISCASLAVAPTAISASALAVSASIAMRLSICAIIICCNRRLVSASFARTAVSSGDMGGWLPQTVSSAVWLNQLTE